MASRTSMATDGACRGNPGPGGWAAIIDEDGIERVLTGGERLTTNNRMELMAVIEGLASFKEPVTITVYTDSSYVADGITKWIAGWRRRGWKTADGKPVKNRDLWERLIAAATGHAITWQWVRGHGTFAPNVKADLEACRAADEQRATR